MRLEYAAIEDMAFVRSLDKHVSPEQYANRVRARLGYVMWDGDEPVGVMHHCVLWDNLPFLNYICVEKQRRHQGFATAAMDGWEADMRRQGYTMVLASTQVDESAQAFYRARGYVDCGGLVFHGTPLDQPMEMFMRKVL